ncbi:DUF1934 domain-containing protein [Paenibacillus sp. NPDC056579]|uniref:DUF1934 domain-containing protein n=1 Tax=unclassified Paenibacillus TaxID=185978 RepID=UPI001EF8F171|nr:DUF1934 domain-containing protein [Paenibacillus sp. H1-7]ULL13269.1 DUF1934 domain-containing protein [Paenibacillus sp. H1-7]
MKKPVHVSIESFADGQRIRQNAAGDLYRKGDHYYVRYDEADPEMKGTVTTIKLEQDRIRLVRSGTVRSELVFATGRECSGSYETPQGVLQLQTMTRSITSELIDGLGIVDWTYDLLVAGEKTGEFRLRLTIAELPAASS